MTKYTLLWIFSIHIYQINFLKSCSKINFLNVLRYLTTELSPKLLLYIFQVIAIKTCKASRTHSGILWTSVYLSLFLLFPSFQNSLQSSVWLIICYFLCGKALLQQSPMNSECLILLTSFKSYFKFSAVYLKLSITYYLVLCVPQFPRTHLSSSLVAQTVKRLLAMQDTRVWFLGWEDPLEKVNGNPLQHSCLENPLDGGSW